MSSQGSAEQNSDRVRTCTTSNLNVIYEDLTCPRYRACPVTAAAIAQASRSSSLLSTALSSRWRVPHHPAGHQIAPRAAAPSDNTLQSIATRTFFRQKSDCRERALVKFASFVDR